MVLHLCICNEWRQMDRNKKIIGNGVCSVIEQPANRMRQRHHWQWACPPK